jgi:endonuclease YncB( thermonuclease family)
MNFLRKFNCFPKLSRCYSAVRTPSVIWEDTIPFKPPITGGMVIKVYDGDTITVASKLPYRKSALYRWSVRIRGIDCPEMKSHDKNEKMVARIAQTKLSTMILNKSVKLENVSNDKYGRVLADVYYKKTNISNFMLKNKLAVEYYGKTKKPPTNWLKYYENEKVLFIPEKKNTEKEKVRRDVLNTRVSLNQTYLKKGMKPIYDTDVEIIV